jgi:hypothetical protein
MEASCKSLAIRAFLKVATQELGDDANSELVSAHMNTTRGVQVVGGNVSGGLPGHLV